MSPRPKTAPASLNPPFSTLPFATLVDTITLFSPNIIRFRAQILLRCLSIGCRGDKAEKCIVVEPDSRPQIVPWNHPPRLVCVRRPRVPAREKAFRPLATCAMVSRAQDIDQNPRIEMKRLKVQIDPLPQPSSVLVRPAAMVCPKNRLEPRLLLLYCWSISRQAWKSQFLVHTVLLTWNLPDAGRRRGHWQASHRRVL